jgi:uncharacterized membrane protein
MHPVTYGGQPRRWVSVLGAAALAAWGAGRLAKGRRPTGTLLAAAGGGLLWHARANGTRSRLGGARGTVVEQAVSINRPPRELYEFWRDLEQLPRVIPQLRAVRTLDGRRSQWVANGRGRYTIWTAEIINDIPHRLIAWRTLDGSKVACAGSVRFESGSPGRGTTVRVKFQYDLPAGRLGAAVARAFGDAPEQVVREGLRRFKQLMETGEIATTDGQPRGVR